MGVRAGCMRGVSINRGQGESPPIRIEHLCKRLQTNIQEDFKIEQRGLKEAFKPVFFDPIFNC